MRPDWKRRLTWVERNELQSAFLGQPFPPRGHRGQLADLAESIARCGVIQPIIARVTCGKLEIVCGYRRWLAAQVAQVDRVPVIVTRLSDTEAELLFMEESVSRWRRDERSAGVAERQASDRAFVEAAEIQGAGADEAGSDSDEATGVWGSRESERIATLVGSEGAGGAALGSYDTAGAPEARRRDLSGVFAGAEDSDEVREDVARHFEEARSILADVRATGTVSRDAVEALVPRLAALRPIARGFDIREVSEDAPLVADPAADSLSWISAHSLRVAYLAGHMAQGLSWTARAVEQVVLAGLLHDIGMVRLPEVGLQSAFPLTRSRQEEIRRHTSDGRALLLRHWPESVADAARDHHERWDGTGYPAGKVGDETGVASRMIGFLDVYAAMICKRSYRGSYLLSEAIRILRDSTRVGLFDPQQERNFTNVFSAWPVGLRGRLAGGELLRVRDVKIGERDGRSDSHLVEVTHAGVSELRWMAESELDARVTEVAPPRAAVRLADLVADVP